MTTNGTPCISGGYVFTGPPEHCKGCIHYDFIESECAKGMTPAWSEEQEAWECDAGTRTASITRNTQMTGM